VPSKKTYTVFNPQCSELFQSVFCVAGTDEITCELCGREHVAPDTDFDTSEADRARMRASVAEDPDKYVDHGDESIFHGSFQGRHAVCGCPCGWDGRYEQFVLGNAHQIVEFLEKQAKRLKEEAEEARSVAGKGRRALK